MNKVPYSTKPFDPAFTVLTHVLVLGGRTTDCPFNPNKQFCTLITLPGVNLNS